MAILNNSNAISSGSYDINNSLRFRSSNSAYLNRTPGSAGNRQIFTISVWLKRGTLGSDYKILSAYSADSDSGLFDLRFSSANVLYIGNWSTGLTTTAVFRDPSAWYHVVLAVDTTQATGSNRIKAYVNGVQHTLNGTVFNQNVTTPWNNNVTQNIGRQARTSDGYFDGYMAEFYNVDGQALTPSSFGETDATTGVWKPKAYTGTYGTNGFYLKFSDIATTSGSNAGLGKDFSGNTNYWTTNNISVTSGTTYDAMIDSPTLTSATVANYAVLSPISGYSVTITNGNLTYTTGVSTNPVTSTWSLPTTGKYYWEVTVSSVGEAMIGIQTRTNLAYAGPKTVYYRVGGANNAIYIEGSTNAYNGDSYTNGDVIAVAYNADASQISWYKNNVQQGGPYTLTSLVDLTPIIIQGSGTGSNSGSINFGQRPFAYTPPTGFVALNTFNLPTPTILQGNRFMDATLYTGTGSALTVTNAGAFKPDLVWVKSRSNAYNNVLNDSVRGSTKLLISNGTDAEQTEAQSITSFNSNGFSLGTAGTWNQSGSTFVGWQWQAGQGSTSSNTSGSITSTVSASTTAGFSVVTYTGNGTTGATIGHGLGVTPKMMIVKLRSGVNSWAVYHSSIGTNYMLLNSTLASTSASAIWNAAPSSSVFTVGNDLIVNTNGGTYVGYCWSEIAGFSKFGSYTGNGSTDGPFVFTNLKPRFIMIKRTDTTSNWTILDTAREGYNVDNDPLYPNLSDAEGTTDLADILSNGFKLRSTDASVNANTGTYIYACFASNPFRNSNAT